MTTTCTQRRQKIAHIFSKSQSLTLPEKLDALDADEQATMCERLHELAEELQNSIQTPPVATGKPVPKIGLPYNNFPSLSKLTPHTKYAALNLFS